VYARYFPVFGSLVRCTGESSICRELHASNARSTCANRSKRALAASVVASSDELGRDARRLLAARPQVLSMTLAW
jgi:hypothetical protein